MNACPPNPSTGIDFKAKQREFTAYIKDPFHHPIPDDVKPQRMEIYRELFFNNVSEFLSSNFPVLKKILTSSQWFELSQAFFSQHACKSPYFSEIPEEFLAYLQNERDHPNDYPFMLELAHYEWVEMALSISKESLPVSVESHHEPLQQQLMLSPLAWSLAYQYPVQKISPNFLPLEPPPDASYLLVYRNQNDEVNFIQTTAVTFRLLQLVEEQPSYLVHQHLQQIATELNQIDSQILIQHGLETIQNLIEKEVLFITSC